MNPRISSALIAIFVAALGLFAPATKPDPIEAARLNNLGCAYMNQQLFEKGLNEFHAALQADAKFSIARLNGRLQAAEVSPRNPCKKSNHCQLRSHSACRLTLGWHCSLGNIVR